MAIRTLFLLCFHLHIVVMLEHEKRVAEKVWSERCDKNTLAMNDCNWCHCDVTSQYKCKARVCREVDMFGHFNDAIQDMDVGMDGHGTWRSDASACEPGVHYRKTDLLCVCTENGKWPNPVCRDVFRVLHSVEPVEHKTPDKNHTCASTKLYLYGCNVCFCPAEQRIDPALCTKRKCDGEDINHIATTTAKKESVEEIYATCSPSKKYMLGCQSCVCLRNNRLLCDNCTVEDHLNAVTCHGKKPGDVFEKNCNHCQCDNKDTIYCSIKKCLSKHTNISLPKLKFNSAEETPDDSSCVPGSKYKRDCNTCYCFMLNGVKYFGCTFKTCNTSKDAKPEKDCVAGTSYKVNCMICHCVLEENVKREYCTIDGSCKLEGNRTVQVSSLRHGYCQPMHFYQMDCNKCRCLADGKTMACTSKLCMKQQKVNGRSGNMKHRATLDTKPPRDPTLITEFIPFIQKDNYCPKGHTYMVDCNICYCMEDGNAICTTKQC